ncbi:MAG: hypothetical protein KAH14_03320 [Clostridiales bacterium]|nr:hypothetical protein [Clostridiales bacterium]
MENLIEYRCGLIDFQIGRDHGQLSFDPAEYIRSCSRSNIKRVMFTCKDAYGDAYYTSDLVKMNPMADGDYLKTAINEAKNLNMELFAYYNVLLDDIYATSHPDDRMVTQEGEKAIAYDYYKSLCPNSLYTDILRQRLADLVFNYDIDGIFFDISYFGGGKCFCDNCKNKFLELYGYELKNNVSPGTPEYADFNEFKRLSRSEFLTVITNTIREIKSIPVIWNGSGSFCLAEPEIDDYSDYITTEFHAPDYLDGITRAKWMQSRGKGYIMSTPCEMGSWGDWTMIPNSTLKSTVCSIAANGGGVFFNHTPYPSGDFAKSHIKCIEQNIGESFRYLEKFEDKLRDTESAAEILLLMSIGSKRFCENGFAGYSLSDFTASLKGAVKMLLESGTAFDIADERELASTINKYKVIVVPSAPCLGNETAQLLMGFVNNGGKLLTCSDINVYEEYGELNIVNPLPAALGYELIGQSDISVEYFSDLGSSISMHVPDMPILVKQTGKLLNVVATEGSTILATKTLPPFEATIEKHVYHQHAHPYKKSQYSSIIKRNNSIYYSADIFRSFYNTSSPWLKRIFLNTLNNLYPDPILKIDAPACVYPTLLKKEGNYLLQIININGPLHEVAKSFPEEMLDIPEVYIETKLDILCIYNAVNGEEIKFADNGEFVLKNVGIHTAVVIET